VGKEVNRGAQNKKDNNQIKVFSQKNEIKEDGQLQIGLAAYKDANQNGKLDKQEEKSVSFKVYRNTYNKKDASQNEDGLNYVKIVHTTPEISKNIPKEKTDFSKMTSRKEPDQYLGPIKVKEGGKVLNIVELGSVTPKEVDILRQTVIKAIKDSEK
jgi:Tfp pilus assembly protein FimT